MDDPIKTLIGALVAVANAIRSDPSSLFMTVVLVTTVIGMVVLSMSDKIIPGSFTVVLGALSMGLIINASGRQVGKWIESNSSGK